MPNILKGSVHRTLLSLVDDGTKSFQKDFFLDSVQNSPQQLINLFILQPMDDGNVKWAFFKNIPNNWLIWADGPNKL